MRRSSACGWCSGWAHRSTGSDSVGSTAKRRTTVRRGRVLLGRLGDALVRWDRGALGSAGATRPFYAARPRSSG
jgi:hypothetical protein